VEQNTAEDTGAGDKVGNSAAANVEARADESADGGSGGIEEFLSDVNHGEKSLRK
jgi:hypothetical protein